VPASDYGAALSPLVLSSTFSSVCATCHGSEGKGVVGKYPEVPGTLDYAGYVKAVRTGSKNMPAFSSAHISDEDLQRDFAALADASGNSEAATRPEGEWSWSEGQVEQAYQAGLQIWRKADSEGAACTNCHTPDAIDLAVIGYADDEIIRRATKHVSLEDARVLVDFVHAQRRRFNIRQACDPATWRPFQPGGEVLPGNTVEERDDALGDHLTSLGLGMATGLVATLDDAHKLTDELLALDLRRKLRVGIAFPRWSDDDFDGDEHRNINDWITEAPPLPRTEQDRTTLFGLHDAYLADPTLENLEQIDRFMLSSLAQPMDFYPAMPKGSPSDLWFNITFNAKARATLLASHYFRMSALGKPSLFEAGPMPVSRADRLYNPAFYIGMKSAENSCFSDQACNSLQFLPAAMREDVPIGATMSEVSHQVSHPWFMVGWMFDHSFMNGEAADVGGEAHTQHYWHDHFAGETVFHQAFIMTVKLLHQQRAFETTRGTPAFPALNADGPPDESEPMLDSYWLQIQGLAGGRAGGQLRLNSRNAAVAIRLHVNLLRAIVFQQIEFLGRGRKIAGRAGLLQTLNGWRTFVSTFVPGAFADPGLGSSLNSLQPHRALLTDDTARLVDELIALIETTPDAAPPGRSQGRGVF